MERYKHISEESLDRRQLIKKIGASLAIFTAGYYGVDTAAIVIKQQKELSKIKAKIFGVDNTDTNFNQYDTYQEPTNNKCEEIIPTGKLTEVCKAETIQNQQMGDIEESNKRLQRGNKRLLQNLVTVSIIEGVLFTADLVSEFGSKIKNGKVRYSR